jgi:hypothetical protein
MAGVVIASTWVGVAIDHTRHEGPTSQVDHLERRFAAYEPDADLGNA